MNCRKFKAVFQVLIIAILLYIVHKILFVITSYNIPSQTFIYPLEIIYLLFATCSLVIISVLIMIKEKSIDNVGYAFLLLTAIKMGIAYVFLKNILNSTHQNVSFEKINFFIAFALFLAIETLATIRLLNNKQ